MSRIEVAVTEDQTAKERGDLLEDFCAKFLIALNYRVEREIRITASELDLLCENTVNGKKIYVECKAYRDTLGADAPKKLLGTVTLEDYSEGWLISTGSLGKDAKGFVEKWSEKPKHDRERLSFFTPTNIVQSFINTRIVVSPEKINSPQFQILQNRMGSWTLLVTTFGTFWVLECLEAGLPKGILAFYAGNGTQVTELALLSNLARTDSSFRELDFLYTIRLAVSDRTEMLQETETLVVPVQQGESWDDYRPARPKDFVGRSDAQTKLLRFLESVLTGNTQTRVFAITGNSGMGKSSLVAKLRDRVKNIHYRRRLFVYAVDVRAARDQSYIYFSLLKAFREAMSAGFIRKATIQITDSSNPFSSESFVPVLKELRDSGKVICLVFDQFEELYSKPELFPLFEKVKDLLHNSIAIQENVVLGFAWKTDSTVYQDHPAYHFWHSLRDQRYTLSLAPFSRGDSEKALTIFENELNSKLPKDLRHQLIAHSQGYPWLLKKLCIHIFNKLKENSSITSLINENLDIKVLFDKDLQELSPPESFCLNLVAQKSPADWFEVAELTSPETLRGLIEKRLLIRSGERVIIYWDIFREYLLTKKVPVLPFNYVPLSPSFATFLNAAFELKPDVPSSTKLLAQALKVSEGTAQNIASDLFMLRIAAGKNDDMYLSEDLAPSDRKKVTNHLRQVFRGHVVLQELKQRKEGSRIGQAELALVLKNHNPLAQNNVKTWALYATRIGLWLTNLGYLTTLEGSWINTEHPIDEAHDFSRRRQLGSGEGFTTFNTYPQKVIDALLAVRHGSQDREAISRLGFTNAVAILKRLGLVTSKGQSVEADSDPTATEDDLMLIRRQFQLDSVYSELYEIYQESPQIGPLGLARLLSLKFGLNWSEGTEKRVGYALASWYKWTMET